MRRILALTFALVLASASLANAVNAQASTTRGFNVGIHLTGSTLELEGDGDRANSGGAGLWLGYGFNRTIQLFVQFDGTKFDVDDAAVEGDWSMGHADLGVRFHFANSLRSWVPYLQAAATARVVTVQNGVINDAAQAEDVSMVGGGLTLGGGIVFYFNESLGLDLQLAWTGGTFTTIEAGNVSYNDLDLDANSARFNIGLSWWP
jgi:hypothetical protein